MLNDKMQYNQNCKSAVKTLEQCLKNGIQYIAVKVRIILGI